jgi:hypothetical protein
VRTLPIERAGLKRAGNPPFVRHVPCMRWALETIMSPGSTATAGPARSNKWRSAKWLTLRRVARDRR